MAKKLLAHPTEIRNQKPAGVFQYFYHCAGEDLPIRDVTKRHKTEPHYENLTENWCSKCMNGRIKSANRNGVKYLFLMTRYFKEGHRRNGKLLVVGFLYRADDEIWRGLSKSIKSEAAPFDSKNPQECGFFAGDKAKSHFVSADDAYQLPTKNGRWKYLTYEDETERIVSHLKRHKNVLGELRKRVRELKRNKYENTSQGQRCTK